MATGCGCKEVYRFPHILMLVSALFCSIPTFCSFFKMFFVLLFIYREDFAQQYGKWGSLRLAPIIYLTTVQEDLLARTLFWRLAICSIFRQYLKRQQNIYGMTH